MRPESERIVFRELIANDVENIQQIFSDPVAMEFYPSTKSVKETEEWINWNRKLYMETQVGLWALIEKSSGNFLGQCGLVLQNDVAGNNEFEIGYLLVRKYWGKGYAGEAALAVKQFALSEFGLDRIISLIAPENSQSLKVAEKIGFTYEQNIKRWGKIIAVYSNQ